MLKKAAKAAWLRSHLNTAKKRPTYAIVRLARRNYSLKRKGNIPLLKSSLNKDIVSVVPAAARKGESRLPRALRGIKDKTKDYPNWTFKRTDRLQGLV